MPRAPKQCAHNGCTTRVTARPYCATHQPTGWISGGPSRTSTTAHRKWRQQVLTRANYNCELREPGCLGTATEADHITSVKLAPHLELDVNNGQAACRQCHTRKTQREAQAARTRTRER